MIYPEWLERFREVTAELSSLHRELATVRISEARAREQAFKEGDYPSVSAADREAWLRAVDFKVEIIRIEGEIAAWQEERNYLEHILGTLGE